jgi:phytoene synthase
VASAVGLICLEIFGYGDPRSRQYAVDLGVALQLTNILRDVPEDLRRGRVYIPQEDLRRHGCSEEDLARESAGGGVRAPKVKALLRQQAERAREYYRKAADGLPRADAQRLLAAQIMGAIYRGILTRIERSDYDVFSRVVRIPRPQRALIAAATWARTAVGLR